MPAARAACSIVIGQVLAGVGWTVGSSNGGACCLGCRTRGGCSDGMSVAEATRRKVRSLARAMGSVVVFRNVSTYLGRRE